MSYKYQDQLLRLVEPGLTRYTLVQTDSSLATEASINCWSPDFLLEEGLPSLPLICESTIIRHVFLRTIEKKIDF